MIETRKDFILSNRQNNNAVYKGEVSILESGVIFVDELEFW